MGNTKPNDTAGGLNSAELSFLVNEELFGCELLGRDAIRKSLRNKFWA